MTMHERLAVLSIAGIGECFGQDVSHIVFCVDPLKFDCSIHSFLMNVVDPGKKMVSLFWGVVFFS